MRKEGRERARERAPLRTDLATPAKFQGRLRLGKERERALGERRKELEGGREAASESPLSPNTPFGAAPPLHQYFRHHFARSL